MKAKSLHLWVGFLLFVIINLFVRLEGNQAKMLGIVVWMAYWWFSEAIHFAVTALLPIVLFPLMGILNAQSTARLYIDTTIFLFIGGFLFSFALQKWNLHQRLALKILSRTGKSASSILIGIMSVTTLLSMWISNTATVLLLLPAVLAIIQRIENGSNEKKTQALATAMLLGLAYSATLGGMATPVGTPTNMIFFKQMQSAYLEQELSFSDWFFIAAPITLISLLLLFFLLNFLFLKQSPKLQEMNFKADYQKLGSWSFEEKWVAILFGITVVLWFTRNEITLAGMRFFGWKHWFPSGELIQDSTVVMLTALCLFFIRSKSAPHEALLEWKDLQGFPIDIIFLFGGGFALAEGFEITGLSRFLAGNILIFKDLHPLVFLFTLCFVITLISEVASNVACIQLALPIIIAYQKELGLDPWLFSISATLAASLGFMLPIATAPNTIVYATQKIPIQRMLIVGLWLDLIGIAVISLWMFLNHNL